MTPFPILPFVLRLSLTVSIVLLPLRPTKVGALGAVTFKPCSVALRFRIRPLQLLCEHQDLC